MKHRKSLVAVSGAACLAAVMAVTAETIEAPGSSPEVRALAERLLPDGARSGAVTIGEDQLVPLCADTTDAGDVVEAALIAGVDVYTAVKDTILACGRQGNGADVARQVATRTLRLRGENVRYLIDGGVIAAAAVIGNRLRGDQRVAADSPPEQRDIERERLERMMQKGLVDDEYRRYIDERRALAASPGYPAGYDYGAMYLPLLPALPLIYNAGGIQEASQQ